MFLDYLRSGTLDSDFPNHEKIRSFFEILFNYVPVADTSYPFGSFQSYRSIIPVTSAAAMVTSFPWALNDFTLVRSGSTSFLLILPTSHLLSRTSLSPLPWDFFKHAHPRTCNPKCGKQANIGPMTGRSWCLDGPGEGGTVCLGGMFPCLMCCI